MDPANTTLLKRFVESRDEHAFRQLVDRHLPMVFSVARRIVGNDHSARDVAQQVFIRLSQKAASVREKEGLTAWLHAATRSLAINTLRADNRRRARESKAANHMSLESVPETTWETLAPLVDDLLARLSADDRRIILMRFYEHRSLESVAAEMGLKEEAAKKRISRALDKLRLRFSSRGITTTTTALSTLLPLHAATAAPAGLATTIYGAALAAPAVGSVGILTFFITMTTTTKVAIGTAIVASIAAVAIATKDTAPSQATTSHATSGMAGDPPASGKGGAGHDPTSTADGRTKSVRDTRPAREKPAGPRVTVPIDKVVAILKAKEPKLANFSDLQTNMESALDLLGVTDREREDVRALVTKAKDEILASEKKLLKPEKVSPSEVRLDLTPMAAASQDIAARLQQGLGTVLPSDLADALIQSVEWDKFYFNSEEHRSNSFKILRDKQGKLNAGMTYHGGGVGFGLDPNEFPDNGSALPADKAFGMLDLLGGPNTRWPDLLGGVTIVPQDEVKEE